MYTGYTRIQIILMMITTVYIILYTHLNIELNIGRT